MERTLFTIIALAVAVATGAGHATACDCCKATTLRADTVPHQFSASSLIVYYDATTGKKPLQAAIKKLGASVMYDYHNFNAIAVKLPKGTTLEQAIKYFQGVDGVLQVSRDRIMKLNTDTKAQ